MRDKNIAQLTLLLKIQQKIQNLCLDGHVQGGDRFVTDNKLGIQRQRPGNPDSLPAAAVQLMGIGVGKPLGQAYCVHELHCLVQHIGFGHAAFDDHRLHNRLTDAHTGIQRGKRVLKDNLHVFPQIGHCLSIRVRNIPSVKDDFA